MVVAPPLIVRPRAALPAPIVEDAYPARPPLKTIKVEVAFPGNKYPNNDDASAYDERSVNVGRPSDDVAMLVSAPVPPGERRRPYEKEPAPVPPLPTPNVPVTCEARLICPASVEKLKQLLLIA